MTKTTKVNSTSSTNNVADFDFKSYQLKKFKLNVAAMPVKPREISWLDRIGVIATILGAVLIVSLYIGVPLVVAVHTHLFPYTQDMVVAGFVILQIGLLMIYTIGKTDGR